MRYPCRLTAALLLAMVMCLPVHSGDLLLDLLDDTGAHMQWDPFRRIGVIVKGEKRITFKEGFSWGLEDYQTVIPFETFVGEAGGLELSSRTASALRDVLASVVIREREQRIVHIVVDPGHGGKDPGTSPPPMTIDGKTIKLVEKEIVLKIGLAVQRMLNDRYPDKNIVMTREKDVYVKLEDRVEVANQLELDAEKREAMVFVSIHVNAALRKDPSGYEVWHIPPEFERNNVLEKDVYDDGAQYLYPILNALMDEEYMLESVLLGREILSGLDEHIGSESVNRGLREEAWFVVRNALMPSVLVEVGYATNPDEALNLNQDEYLMRIAAGIYNGITRFVDSYESTGGFTE